MKDKILRFIAKKLHKNGYPKEMEEFSLSDRGFGWILLTFVAIFYFCGKFFSSPLSSGAKEGALIALTYVLFMLFVDCIVHYKEILQSIALKLVNKGYLTVKLKTNDGSKEENGLMKKIKENTIPLLADLSILFLIIFAIVYKLFS